MSPGFIEVPREHREGTVVDVLRIDFPKWQTPVERLAAFPAGCLEFGVGGTAVPRGRDAGRSGCAGVSGSVGSHGGQNEIASISRPKIGRSDSSLVIQESLKQLSCGYVHGVLYVRDELVVLHH